MDMPDIQREGKLLALVDGGTLVLGDQMGRCLDNWRDAGPRCDF
jgi:hypothetical protein